MPTFEFTSPEGKKYRVNGPEGSTKEQAFGILQQQLGASAPMPAVDPRYSGAAAIPGVTPQQLSNARASAPAAKVQEEDNLLGKIVGPVDAALGVVSGALTPLVAVPGGFVKSAYDEKVKGIVRSPEENAIAIRNRLQYQPVTATGRKILETVGEAAPVLDALPGMAGELSQLSRTVPTATRGVSDLGAAGTAKLTLAQMKDAVPSVVPKIDPATAGLARLAQEKYGIPLRPDQLYENKLSRMAGEASEKVPLSGAKTDVRQEAFNKGVIRAIGGDETATRLTPDVFDQAIRKSGQQIGNIAAKHPLPLDAKLSGALESNIQNAIKYETSDVGRVVTNYIEDLRSKAVDGVIPGEAVRKLNTAITNRMRSTSDGDLRHALGNLQEAIHDAVQVQLSGEDLATLRGARRQYASAKTVEPLVAKSSQGDISPAGLMGRVTSDNAGKSRMARGQGGDLGELARIGQRFLKEPASSGTAERGLVYGLAGGGVVAEPTTAASVYSAANLYNRAGPAIARRLSGAQKPARTTLAELAKGEE